MMWFSKLFGSTPSPSQGPSLASLKLAAPWGREVERSDRRVVWLDASGVPLSFDLVNGSARSAGAYRRGCCSTVLPWDRRR